MTKLILVPLAVLVIPQAIWFAFWRFLWAVGQPTTNDSQGEMLFLWGSVALLSFFAGCATAGGWLLDGDTGAIVEHQRERKRLREKREAELAALDAAIGIPRIPSMRR